MNYQYESEFPKLANFRCLEGFKCSDGSEVKTGVLYRSARPDVMSAEECERFKRFGINSIVDLRRKDEYLKARGAKRISNSYPTFFWKKGEYYTVTKRKKPVSELPRKKHLIIPLFCMALIWRTFGALYFFIRWPSLILALIDKICGTYIFVRFYARFVVNKTSLAENYFGIIEYTKPMVLTVLKTLLNAEDLPVLVHCSQGKDRTGVICMLVLSALGVSEEDIVQDYARSEKGLLSVRTHTVKEVCGMYGFKDAFTRARPDTMIELLQLIRMKYGSVVNYLDEIGFDESHREKLRILFTESC